MIDVLLWIAAGVAFVASQFLAVEVARRWRFARRRLHLARQRSPEHRLAGVTEQAVAAMIHEARLSFERTLRSRS